MTRNYALTRLLEHGPMTRAQLIECTRWSDKHVDMALGACLAHRLVRRAGSARIGDSKVATLYRAVKG